jgi:hypothetical protein
VGVFFSVWVTSALIGEQQFAYNIHSLRIRELPGYRLVSRGFAEAFRDAVRGQVSTWPNLRSDLGPRTLLEGRVAFNRQTFDADVNERIDGFVEVHPVIDRLLQEHAVR